MFIRDDSHSNTLKDLQKKAVYKNSCEFEFEYQIYFFNFYVFIKVKCWHGKCAKLLSALK